MSERLGGPLLVALAALLWGTDSLARFTAAERFDATFIVFVEHAAGIAVLLPWIWWRHRADLFNLGPKEWFCALVAGAGGSAVATVLFTASFRYLNPSVIVLLQKLQPIFTVALAALFLGERPEGKFYPWAALALASAFILSFPDLDVGFLAEPGNLHAKGVFYSLGACALWAVATVAGRRLLDRATAPVATFWRFFFGLGMLVSILQLARIPSPPAGEILAPSMLLALGYLSFVTGIIPMLAYYAGLARTQASVATFVELLYPITALAFNAVFLSTALSTVQLVATGLLLLSVTMISI